MKRKLIMTCFWLLVGCLAVCCSKGGGQENTDDGRLTVNYQASSAIFSNPERGFMHTYSTLSDNNSLNATTLAALRDRNVSIFLRVIYLQDYKDQPISAEKLAAIQSDMEKVRNEGLKIILRFAYTDNMDGTDAPIEIVEQHLDQLKPIFEDNEDIIAFIQAGFVGAWGEWHNSSNGLASPENSQRVLFKLLEVVPSTLMVQLRTPILKQRIFNTSQPVTQANADQKDLVARVGHHNDCFLSNATDYGTYTDNNVQAEKNYISQDALFVPTGGETCPPTGGFSPNCTEGRNQMRLLKWTYLNLDWYQPTINLWRSSGCFEEFQRNLGYRLVLESSVAHSTAVVNDKLLFGLNIVNRGYAPMYHQKNVGLVLKNKTTGNTHELSLSFDLRSCRPDQSTNFEQELSLVGIPAGEYDLLLKISDRSVNLKDRPEYAVRLANEQVWEAETGLNRLLRQLTIN